MESISKSSTTLFEKVCVFILFLAFFDTNLFFLESTLKVLSYLIIFVLLALRLKRCLYVATLDISLLLLASMALLSFFWSADPNQTSNVSRSYIREILFGVYLAAQFPPRQLFKLFTVLFSTAILLTWILSILFIAAGQAATVISQVNNEPSWQGLTVHKQYLGRMSLIASIIFLLNALNNKKVFNFMWIQLGLSSILLFLSRSKTSWVGFIISLALLPIHKFSKTNYKVRVAFYIAFLFIVGSIAILLIDNLQFIVTDILLKPVDFNGRFDIWNLAIISGLKHPWFGYGYGAFWGSDEGLNIINSTWYIDTGVQANLFHAHNGYIDLFLQLGLVGLSIFIFNVLAVLKRTIDLIHLTRSVESFWFLEFMVVTLLMQVTETLTMVSHSTLCAIYVSISLSTILWVKALRKSVVLNKYLALEASSLSSL